MPNHSLSFVFHPPRQPGHRPLKTWTHGVPLEHAALQQLYNTASLPFIHKHVAAMPDVHYGRGSTIGSVIPTDKAIIPACVGVDLGCGMVAMDTGLDAADLPDNLKNAAREHRSNGPARARRVGPSPSRCEQGVRTVKPRTRHHCGQDAEGGAGGQAGVDPNGNARRRQSLRRDLPG